MSLLKILGEKGFLAVFVLNIFVVLAVFAIAREMANLNLKKKKISQTGELLDSFIQRAIRELEEGTASPQFVAFVVVKIVTMNHLPNISPEGLGQLVGFVYRHELRIQAELWREIANYAFAIEDQIGGAEWRNLFWRDLSHEAKAHWQIAITEVS